MCIIFLAYQQNSDYPFILSANRDEFYHRPSRAAEFWREHPQLLAGKDIQGGGTWLGITQSGRFAALTNYRDATMFDTQWPNSRGSLTQDFLLGEQSPKDYLSQLMQYSENYAGFNLLLGDKKGFYFFSNKEEKIKELTPGIYAISNSLLDTPWPKVTRGKKLFSSKIKNPCHKSLVKIMQDKQEADKNSLPKTGLGLVLEKVLSPIFIHSPNYGTRVTTTITYDKTGLCQFSEQEYNNKGEQKNLNTFEFLLS